METETVRNIKPIVLTSVTLGKELHAGHLLILSSAELLRRGLGSTEPTLLLNNNTGPRAAGTLVSLSERLRIGFEDTARILSEGFIASDRLVEAYRGRVVTSTKIDEALDFLDQRGFDIFARNANLMESELGQAGFSVRTVSEAANIQTAHPLVEKVNPAWADSGFMFLDNKGIKILKRAGRLTATGKCFVSLCAVAQSQIENEVMPLLLFVDSEPDTLDSAVAFSSFQELGVAKRVLASGISLNGHIASGTTGEALTLSEIAKVFEQQAPTEKLSQTLRFLVLTMPIRRVHGELYTPFDFRDNDSFMRVLIDCFSKAQTFTTMVRIMLSGFEERIDHQTKITDPQIAKWFAFLPQKVAEVENEHPEKILGNFGRTKVIRSSDEIQTFVERQGYVGEEKTHKVVEYSRGKEIEMIVRRNPYFDRLTGIMSMDRSVSALSLDDFVNIQVLINNCLERLGLDE